jgi:hypothetical protein
MHSLEPENLLEVMRDFIESGHSIDDLASITIATSLVNARLPASLKTDLLITNIVRLLNPHHSCGLFAILWILSKYGTERDILEVCVTYHKVWAASEPLSRLVGGLYPRMLKTTSFDGYIEMTKRFSNQWLRAVLEFYISISQTQAGYNSVSKFLLAANSSLLNKISHPKFLMILAVCHNSTLSPNTVAHIKKCHSYGLSDDFYRLVIA